MKKAIVTLNIGQQYQTTWRNICRKGWQAYCERHGYELVNLDKRLDPSDRANKRSPAWQKLLILSQDWSAGYDRIVWVDSDIVINATAPDVIDDTPEGKIGCTDEFAYPTVKDHKAIMTSGRIHLTSGDATAFHTCVGLPAASHIVQTGVMVLSPKHHRELFEHVYSTYEDPGTDRYYEMRFLSHEVQKANLQHWINPKFNALLIWLALADIVKTGRQPTNKLEMGYFLMEQFFRNFFIHFGGHQDWMQIVSFVGG
ncbi:MAG TPA: hypothetical protein VGR52_03810 [Stellaceae bacterium]|nr:hypothetical protein [Stellaceae bacterium]